MKPPLRQVVMSRTIEKLSDARAALLNAGFVETNLGKGGHIQFRHPEWPQLGLVGVAFRGARVTSGTSRAIAIALSRLRRLRHTQN